LLSSIRVLLAHCANEVAIMAATDDSIVKAVCASILIL